ncbi:selenoprotein L [Archocentrus centrarchus]|uniref:selenoprotein L n=1 Tax=Archocentrus centrarchus TaxID=63155 RepID=UPI0011E9EF64|nr:peroxiredoxin-like 2C [Archocentrus centrarchus]
MAEDVAVSEETLTDALSLLVNMGKVLLQNAKEEAAASLENFVPHKITTLFGLITAGANFYKSLGVKKKSEAEAIWQKSYHCAAVREQVEELLQLENEWDSFLESVDEGLQTTDVQLSGGNKTDSLSPETLFTDGRSGKSVTLGQYLGQGQSLLLVLTRHFGCLLSRDHVTELEACQALLEARSVRVLIVSFGSVEGAQLWLEQTGCTFDILLDPQRKVYRSFGLGSSYIKVMKFDCLLQYSNYVAANIDFPDFPHRLLEDLYQLGGDFLLDDAGKVLLSHPSKNPLDRPTVEDVLQAVDRELH